MNYKIDLLMDEDYNLMINKHLAHKLGIPYLKHTNIRFGFNVSEATVIIDEQVKENEVLISKKLLKKLSLPLDCSYHLKVENNEIEIGPFIGVCMGHKRTSLIKKMKELGSYSANYSKINGVIFAFVTDDINKEGLKVKGFMYNPEIEIWNDVTLPLPASIFKRNPLTKGWREYLGAIYGSKVFNYKAIDKWEMISRLQQFAESSKIIPETIRYDNMPELISFLKVKKNVYIKPSDGKKGLGIFNVQIKCNNIIIKTRKDGLNYEWKFDDYSKTADFLDSHLSPKKYIIQKTVDIKVGTKVMDFRIGMDKDQNGEWKNVIFVTRVSDNDSIVSNRAAGGGEIMSPDKVLKDIYGMNKVEVNEYKSRLVKIAKVMSEKLDLTGLDIGKLAFDLSIDNEKNIWLIEVNNKYPDDSLAKEIGNMDAYYNVRLLNMLYSKRKAGFYATEAENTFTIRSSKQEKSSSIIASIYVSVPGLNENKEKKENYLRMCSSFDGESCAVKKAIYNNELKKVEIVVQGSKTSVDKYIHFLKSHSGQSKRVVISVSERVFSS
ncbi:YheC/YheD family protein [Alteribacter aurantiacus]|uniref:YheC/YheD family protein n=1 Tax=Alteribacter aurantiacus TaxID=254410 RepID=UPI00041FAAF8|nr:YheC/YheD family protein [Alteribacter aurantiacus]